MLFIETADSLKTWLIRVLFCYFLTFPDKRSVFIMNLLFVLALS